MIIKIFGENKIICLISSQYSFLHNHNTFFDKKSSFIVLHYREKKNSKKFD